MQGLWSTADGQEQPVKSDSLLVGCLSNIHVAIPTVSVGGHRTALAKDGYGAGG